MDFSELGLSAPLIKAIADKGYSKPTPIQQKGIPPVLEGRDVMAAAQTGTGKTAGFALPILERLSAKQRPRGNIIRALILTPTRELAMQVHESVRAYGQHLSLTSEVVYGGVKINPQMMRLRGGADILVATPGRLLDLYQQNAVKFDRLEILVLDEADRMLDMGFIHDIRKIIACLPKKRQNLLFSATFSDDIRQLAKGIIHNPVEFSVTPRNATATSVKQHLYVLDKKQKTPALCYLIGSEQWSQVLVFSRTKHGANKLVKSLDQAGIKAAAIHGNKSQGARTRALAEFKAGKVQALVATDIAARGIDIDQLPQVVNFDLPNVPEDYVHRIGRTGRAGATGAAISLVSADEIKQLLDIERLTGKKIRREYLEDFYPSHELPESKPKSSPRPKNNNGNKKVGDAKPGPRKHKNPKPFGSHTKKKSPSSKPTNLRGTPNRKNTKKQSKG